MPTKQTTRHLPLTAKLIVSLILLVLVFILISLASQLFFMGTAVFLFLLQSLLTLSLFITSRLLFFLPTPFHTTGIIWAIIAPLFAIPISYATYLLADLPDAWKRRLAFIGLLSGAITLTTLITPYLTHPLLGGFIALLVALLISFTQFKLFPDYLDRTRWLTLNGVVGFLSGLLLTSTLTHSEQLNQLIRIQIAEAPPWSTTFSTITPQFMNDATKIPILAVGSFLIPMVILLLGSWLLSKKNLFINFMEGFNQLALIISPHQLGARGKIVKLNDPLFAFAYTANNPDYPKLYSSVITLTPDDVYHAIGSIWLIQKEQAPVTIEFNYATWDNDGGNIWHSGDGIALMFLKNGDAYHSQHPKSGGQLGFLADGTGYGLLFKTYGARSVQLVDGNLNLLAKKRVNTYTHGKWTHVKVIVNPNKIDLYLNQQLTLTWEGTVDQQYTQIGFSAATGGADSRQQIKNIRITTP